MSTLAPIRPVPRWLHIWAILTVIATTCLLALGGLVTTFRVGMADPVWPTTPWYLFFINWQEPSRGFLIEHTHRLAGWTVGVMTIVLALGLWFTARRGASGMGLRYIGIASLAGVTIQGLLGGFRVRLNALAGTDLAAVHGIFAQFVFALLVASAVMSAARTTKPELLPDDRARCHRIAMFLVGIVFVQLIWGALIRHNPTPAVQRLHLLTAFVVLATAVWLIKTARESSTTWNRLNKASLLLAVFLAFQIILGVEAWMGKFTGGVLPELQKVTVGQAIVRTAHVLVGTGILATSVGFFLLTRRPALIAAAVRINEPISRAVVNPVGGIS